MNAIHDTRTRRRPPRGLSLLEVVMVTIIIGILVTLTVPSFRKAIEQSRSDMASANLRAIWSAQRLYWLENRTYASNLATLEALDLVDSSIASQTFYSFEISFADATHFTASATRVANSTWNGGFSITETGTVSGALNGSDGSSIAPSL